MESENLLLKERLGSRVTSSSSVYYPTTASAKKGMAIDRAEKALSRNINASNYSTPNRKMCTNRLQEQSYQPVYETAHYGRKSHSLVQSQ